MPCVTAWTGCPPAPRPHTSSKLVVSAAGGRLRCRRRLSRCPAQSMPSAFHRVLKDRPSVDIPAGVHSRLLSQARHGAACCRARSVLAVPPGLDGFLRHRVRGLVASRSRPWGPPGFRAPAPHACGASTLPHRCPPSRAFPSREVSPASPREPAPLPFVGDADPTTRPCSARESVTTTDRVRSAPPDALLGFPSWSPTCGPVRCTPEGAQSVRATTRRWCAAEAATEPCGGSAIQRDPRTACDPRAAPTTQRRGEDERGRFVPRATHRQGRHRPVQLGTRTSAPAPKCGPRRPTQAHAVRVRLPRAQRPASRWRADRAAEATRPRARISESPPLPSRPRGARRTCSTASPKVGRAVGRRVCPWC